LNRNKQNPDFLHIGEKLLKWYSLYGRDLPFRKTNDPYIIWICEIIFQQTRIKQGIEHFNRFIHRFPDVETLAEAHSDEVLLYWKGLGYYSRAINIHKAAHQIMDDFNGEFPKEHKEILGLKGVGKYTAAAISSISFGGQYAAVDGNFYRVLSRVFADDFDISSSKAFEYFSELASQLMVEGKAGNFNQAMMDVGSEICKPKNPICEECPISEDCLAFATGRISEFPVKLKKTKVQDLKLTYYYIVYNEQFIIRQRGDEFIWKNLFEFPDAPPPNFENNTWKVQSIKHKLSHLQLEIEIYTIEIESEDLFIELTNEYNGQIVDFESSKQRSFPKPLDNFLEKQFETS